MARPKQSQVVVFEKEGSLHLRTTQRITLEAATAEAPATSWIQIATVGSFKKGDRKFSITPAMLSEMVDNFDSGKHPVPPTELVVDFEHLSADGGDNPLAGQAAGWIKALELREDGAELFAKVEWTEDAAALIREKKFKLVSPEFAFNFTTPTMEPIGCTLLAAAITNRPFLQGMQPITLTARPAGEPIRLTDLSYEQRRILVERALRGRLRAGGDPYDWCYVAAMTDEVVVYECGGGPASRYLQEAYTISDDGDVTLAGEPVEVVMGGWTPLGTAELRAKGAEDMKTITLKGTDGKDVQIPETAIEDLPIVKDLRTQLADRVPKTELAAVQAENVKLVGRVEAVEKTLTERDADAAVEALVSAGKASDGQRATLKKLYLSSKEMFDEVTSGFVARVDTTEHGHGNPGPTQAQTATDEVITKAAKLRSDDPKLTVEQSIDKVLATDKTLYAKYVRETEGKVAVAN